MTSAVRVDDTEARIGPCGPNTFVKVVVMSKEVRKY